MFLINGLQKFVDSWLRFLKESSFNWQLINFFMYIIFLYGAVNCQVDFSDDDDEEIKIYRPKPIDYVNNVNSVHKGPNGKFR